MRVKFMAMLLFIVYGHKLQPRFFCLDFRIGSDFIFAKTRYELSLIVQECPVKGEAVILFLLDLI